MRCRSTCALLVALALGWTLAGCGSSEGPAAGVPASINGGTADEAANGTPAPPARPQVLIRTSLGEFTVELDPEHAPLTVRNFLDYVDRGHYNQTIFHQVVSGYVVLGGGYTADLTEKPTHPTIRNEADNGLSNLRGKIAMARQADAIDSSASQFFINVTDNPDLDHHGRTAEDYGYCVFGEVVTGMDVVDRIAQAKVHDTADFEMLPVETVSIESTRRVR